MLIHSVCFFQALLERPKKLQLSLDRTSIVDFTKFSSLQIMLNNSSSKKKNSLQKHDDWYPMMSRSYWLWIQGHTDYDVKAIHVHCINHDVKVTNARIPPEETWQVWYLRSWIWLGQRVSQCILDLFPRRSCAVWPLSWPPVHVCSPGACSNCPLTCSCVHTGDTCTVWNSERWKNIENLWVFLN